MISRKLRRKIIGSSVLLAAVLVMAFSGVAYAYQVGAWDQYYDYPHADSIYHSYSFSDHGGTQSCYCQVTNTSGHYQCYLLHNGAVVGSKTWYGSGSNYQSYPYAHTSGATAFYWVIEGSNLGNVHHDCNGQVYSQY